MKVERQDKTATTWIELTLMVLGMGFIEWSSQRYFSSSIGTIIYGFTGLAWLITKQTKIVEEALANANERLTQIDERLG